MFIAEAIQSSDGQADDGNAIPQLEDPDCQQDLPPSVPAGSSGSECPLRQDQHGGVLHGIQCRRSHHLLHGEADFLMICVFFSLV